MCPKGSGIELVLAIKFGQSYVWDTKNRGPLKHNKVPYCSKDRMNRALALDAYILQPFVINDNHDVFTTTSLLISKSTYVV